MNWYKVSMVLFVGGWLNLLAVVTNGWSPEEKHVACSVNSLLFVAAGAILFGAFKVKDK